LVGDVSPGQQVMAAHHAGADKANAQRLVHVCHSGHALKSARTCFIVNNTALFNLHGGDSGIRFQILTIITWTS
jgi:hypothetical protein